MASVDECEAALHVLAERLAGSDTSAKNGFDRTLSCRLRDLDAIFRGRLENGTLTGITRTDSADAQIRLELSSDDLIKLVAGSLKVGSAMASGRLKIGAGFRDMIRLRSIF